MSLIQIYTNKVSTSTVKAKVYSTFLQIVLLAIPAPQIQTDAMVIDKHSLHQ